MASISSIKSVRVAAPSRATRTAVVVRASSDSVDRRAFLGVAAAALLALPLQAKAMSIPSQDSTGGMGIGGGSMTKSATAASAEGYTMEGYPGTKKPSYLDAGTKQAMLSKARADAMKVASK